MCWQLLYLFITSLHYIVTYIVVHLNDNFPWYVTWFTWCFSFSSFSWNMIFGYFWVCLRKLFQKNYQRHRRDIFTSCCHVYILSEKVVCNDVASYWTSAANFQWKICVVLGEKARTGHIISQYSYTSDTLVLSYLIW